MRKRPETRDDPIPTRRQLRVPRGRCEFRGRQPECSARRRGGVNLNGYAWVVDTVGAASVSGAGTASGDVTPAYAWGHIAVPFRTPVDGPVAVNGPRPGQRIPSRYRCLSLSLPLWNGNGFPEQMRDQELVQNQRLTRSAPECFGAHSGFVSHSGPGRGQRKGQEPLPTKPIRSPPTAQHSFSCRDFTSRPGPAILRLRPGFAGS